MSTIRYIADWHWDHTNILRYDNRPWKTVREMDSELIRLWNETVAKDDIVYSLGDMVWSGKIDVWKDVLSQLNGQIFIVKGNHDETWILNELKDSGLITGWSHQEVVLDPKLNGKSRYVVLNHSPMPFFVNMHHNNTYHLYGHVHISFDAQVIKHVRKQIEDLYLHDVRMYNCGCMIPGMGYVPRTLDEIIEIDKTNRKNESETLEDYLKAKIELGHDKARLGEITRSI